MVFLFLVFGLAFAFALFLKEIEDASNKQALELALIARKKAKEQGVELDHNSQDVIDRFYKGL